MPSRDLIKQRNTPASADIGPCPTRLHYPASLATANTPTPSCFASDLDARIIIVRRG